MKIHPGFASARSVVLHHFGTDPKYEQWRSGFFRSQNLGMFDGDDLGVLVWFDVVRLATIGYGVRATTAEFRGLTVAERRPTQALTASQFHDSSRQHPDQPFARNPILLYGVGLIDAIPEQAIVELATLEQGKYPKAAGRPAKQKDGKVGRFGWKAQKPSLEDFALTASPLNSV